jgi:hypothetical protein
MPIIMTSAASLASMSVMKQNSMAVLVSAKEVDVVDQGSSSDESEGWGRYFLPLLIVYWYHSFFRFRSLHLLIFCTV